MERKIKRIYNNINGQVRYFTEELEKYNDVYNDYINDISKILFIDTDSRECKCLDEKEFINSIKSMEYFDGEINNSGLDYLNIDDCSLYMEVKVLRMFNKTIEEIIEIISNRRNKFKNI